MYTFVEFTELIIDLHFIRHIIVFMLIRHHKSFSVHFSKIKNLFQTILFNLSPFTHLGLIFYFIFFVSSQKFNLVFFFLKKNLLY
ncbi:hypothetical protein GLOIN_2v1593981 [Rhizophagus irregularis DAOM 181602=DAOM 197198]|uniref:Uncharacterized protein n=1 Tax=Rhizophagus irregularis (strain DAOM 181602 / DAOM 197198 / MUCL 43194) TaxID=747089 RepID=A0A2P4Q4R8_RHIID|nr:hypothetical protein GLOIN_2v1593981 [Rhizophagus irregularis DAOM 181602=DAOM 197198]POG72641.1 hypothetical protein GLOIN_2v1593981 [Rhizophagus irregularis DAOM 181602=DAOM 197198]|eukprot:XP_025179507.1 hypothetical protein GLOIN_2v1593981 [Rhizophagus irregularis DAOM 181602=DAOM 197198]